MKSSSKQILIIISICICLNAIFSSLSNNNNEAEISNIGKSTKSTDDDQYLFGAPENQGNFKISQNQINNSGSIQSPDKPISTLDQILPVAQLKKAINKEKYVVHITVIQ